MGNCMSPATAPDAPVPADASTKAKVHGLTLSCNCLSPLLAGMDSDAAEFAMLDIMKGEHMTPEFLKKNPFHLIPTLEEADGFTLGESCTILRYLATKYNPALYPADAKLRARIDSAMDAFATTVYGPWKEPVYAVMGFGAPPADGKKAAEELKVVLDAFATAFVGKEGKYICGDVLTIADYKALPFLYCLAQPVTEAKTGVKLSERMRTYVDGVFAACKSNSMLTSCGGFSVKEWIEGKKEGADYAGEAVLVGEVAEKCLEATPGAAKEGETGLKIHGLPLSANCLGPILIAQAAGVGNLEQCDVMGGAHKAPEFLAKNPFGKVPTLETSDGFMMAESNSQLRFIAANYKPELYPTEDVKVAAKIDYAVDAITCSVYPKTTPVFYPIMGFAEAPGDMKKAVDECTEAFKMYEDTFLSSSKFVNGDKVSIAEYKMLPFLFALSQPVVKAKTGFEPSERLAKYLADMKEAISCDILSSAGGFSLAEFLATKA